MGRVLGQLDIPSRGSFDEVKAHRRIRFFDTAERGFNDRRYIFRERVDVDSDECQVTLKYRHADRYVAQDRDMRPKDNGDDAETKFEEDVKPPFVSVFSYSTTVKIDPDQEFGRVEQVVELFPGLADELRDADTGGNLTVVDDFCARELVLVGAEVLLGKRDIDAECAMVIWHDDGSADAAGLRRVQLQVRGRRRGLSGHGGPRCARPAPRPAHEPAGVGRPRAEDEDGLRLPVGTRAGTDAATGLAW